MKIIILKIGKVDPSILVFIQNGLKGVFADTEIGISKAIMPIPLEVYDASRQQYHSTSILAMMGKQFGTVGAERLLGVTEVDLFVPSLNFVFGEAENPGKAAIISLFRLKPEFYGHQRNDSLFHERALKEAVHEIGHTLGVPHCEDSLCVMFFSNSIQMTDSKRSRFCQRCGKRVVRALREFR